MSLPEYFCLGTLSILTYISVHNGYNRSLSWFTLGFVCWIFALGFLHAIFALSFLCAYEQTGQVTSPLFFVCCC